MSFPGGHLVAQLDYLSLVTNIFMSRYQNTKITTTIIFNEIMILVTVLYEDDAFILKFV